MADEVILVDAGSATLTGETPSSEQSYVLSPGAGALSASGEVPSFVVDNPIPVGSGALTLAGQTPVVQRSGYAFLTLSDPNNYGYFAFNYITASGSGWNGPAYSADITLPLPEVAGALDSPLELPVPEVSASGFAGNAGSAELDALAPVVAASSLTGMVAEGEAVLPALEIAASGDHGAALTLPLFVVTGQVPTGETAQAGLVLPALVATGDSDVYGVLSGALALPLLEVDVAMNLGFAASVAVTLKQIALAAEGYSGTVGTVELAFPVFETDAAGYPEYSAIATLTLPMLQLAATASNGDTETYSTYAVNTLTNGLTAYSGFNFNSFAEFNGVYLAAGAAGIYALTGATDDGVYIDAVARAGVTDFGALEYKRVEYAYLGYKTDGQLELRVTTDAGTTFSYPVHATGKSPAHTQRVMLAKGARGRYWQFEVANADGADFTFESIDILPVVLPRKIG